MKELPEPNLRPKLSDAKADTGKNIIPGSPRNIQVFRSLTPKHEAGQPKANQTAVDLITTTPVKLAGRQAHTGKNAGGSPY